MILIDSNVFMYAAGAPHAYKNPSVDFLRRVARGEVDGVTDAEVLQEILHRYRSINRWEDGKSVYDLTVKVVSRVIPLDRTALDHSRRLMERFTNLMARDAIHASICIQTGAELCSFDADFDQIPGLVRIQPG